MCGHTFCASCIFDHARLSPAREISCPTCRMPLVMAPPALSRQLSAFVDRVREGFGNSTPVGGETLEEWHGRQRAWDARAEEARAQWGVWPETEEDEDEDQWMEEQEPLLYDQTFFKLREVTPLTRLKAAFCQRKQVYAGQVDFLFAGVAIEDDDTPEGLSMMEGDIIDAVWAPTLVERERVDVQRARVLRAETERPVAPTHDGVAPAERVRPRQTRHAQAERSARYMRGEGRCLNVCVESWLED